MPITLPKIAVLPSKFLESLRKLDDEVTPLTVNGFAEVMDAQWASDAHYVCYRPSDNFPQDSWPRIAKVALSRIRAAGGDVLTTCFSFDFDNPGHRTWDGEKAWDEWVELLAGIAADWPAAGDFNLVYATRHGARLVYILDKPIPADVSEDHHRWMVAEFTARGMRLDPKCSDWTRVFRLPNVMREGKATWNLPEVKWRISQPNTFLKDVEQMPKVKGNDHSVYGDIQSIDEPKPDKDSCLSLIRTPTLQHTEWCKEARKHLRGRPCFDVIWNHTPIDAEKRGRNNSIHQHVGQAIGILIDHNVEGTTPDHVYAMFLDAVEQLEPDNDTPDWTDVLWDHVKRLYAKQTAKIVAVEQEEAKAAEVEQAQEFRALSKWESIIQGMREWCDSPILHDASDNNRAAIEWASQHLIVIVGQMFYVMGPNGRYFSEPLLSQQLVPHIQRQGLTDIIATVTISDGVVKQKTLSDILSDHATVAMDVSVSASKREGGHLHKPDTTAAQFIASAFCINPELTPEYNDEVDTWLRHLFGLDYDLGCRWIGNALAFDEGGIAALSIKGEQGSGKKLLVVGLSECLLRPAVADHNDLTSQYQYGLLKSPILCINEGFPRMNREVTPYHTFRLLVSGDPFRANRRYMHPIEVTCPYRIIFTANNDNIVESLVGQGNLSPEDREALAIRLIHLDVGDRATRWLRAMGGMVMTGKPGKRWIRGDGGEPSDFVVARHFLYLYHNRSPLRGSRLLVEGNCNADIMFKLRTQGGAAPLVVECLVKMLNLDRPPDGVVVEENRIFVLTQSVLDFFRIRMSSSTREMLTGAALRAVLVGLSKRTFKNAFCLKSQQRRGRCRWIEIDAGALLGAAERMGDQCGKLAAIVEAQTRFSGKDQYENED